jgi:carbamoyl-phosphate synthase large subunit
VLQKYGVEMIGANEKAIEKAEDRLKFKDAMTGIGLHSAKSGIAHSMDEALAVQRRIAHEIGGNGFPMVIRPSFTLGGTGGGIAYNPDEFEEICKRGLDLSPTKELLIEESLIGWKEFEMEVVRDKADNCIIVCSIENLDPMGIHTGDSITVAPAQTLSDKEYQLMRNASIAILREIGVETGGSNVQFAVNPKDGRMVVIEMNPRVSRSSALASKATGFPIAKVAAKLAVGYTLDELKNDITGGATPASFEPSIDYVVTKIPRFAFEKFPAADSRLTTQMKSVGEVMAMGRTFQESLQKALRGLETGIDGLSERSSDREEIVQEIGEAGPERLLYVGDAFRVGMSAPRSSRKRRSTRGSWRRSRRSSAPRRRSPGASSRASRSPRCASQGQGLLRPPPGAPARQQRERGRASATPRTCGRSTSGSTPAPPSSRRRPAYMYSTYDEECEAEPTDRKKIMVLGGGPNRIGQGIEFDYCCVHAALAMREDGYETIMVNCNPETVSTDYDTSDRLYFEPVTLEDVLEIVAKEKPVGVIVQYGGQTPLKLALALEKAGVPIVGTSPDSIDIAEDRERFQKLLHELGLKQPPNRTARTEEQALLLAQEIGYPLVVRPSYVLGGRAMEIVHGDKDLERYMREAVKVSEKSPVLLDRFLDDAIEVDVDCISDGDEVMIGGIMEHVEQAGIHFRRLGLLAAAVLAAQAAAGRAAPADDADGQGAQRRRPDERAVRDPGRHRRRRQPGGRLRARGQPAGVATVPFVSKATAQPLAKIAARCMVGQKLSSQPLVRGEVIPDTSRSRKAVFPFNKFPGVDPILGPRCARPAR